MAYKKTNREEVRVRLPEYVMKYLENVSEKLDCSKNEVIYNILSKYVIDRTEN